MFNWRRPILTSFINLLKSKEAEMNFLMLCPKQWLMIYTSYLMCWIGTQSMQVFVVVNHCNFSVSEWVYEAENYSVYVARPWYREGEHSGHSWPLGQEYDAEISTAKPAGSAMTLSTKSLAPALWREICHNPHKIENIVLTHWLMGYVNVILDVPSSNVCHWFISGAFSALRWMPQINFNASTDK